MADERRANAYLIGGWVAGVALVLCLCVGCVGGAWALFGPVNYFGCGFDRPDDVTSADFVGAYVTDDGARLELRADGTLSSSGLYDDVGGERVQLSSGGRWTLRDPSVIGGPIKLVFDSTSRSDGGMFGTYLDFSGTRSDPWLYWFVGDPDSCHIYRFNPA